MRNVILVFFLVSFGVFSQQETQQIITLQEYLGYVKQYHPIVKQANLIISESEAKLLKSRGAFDPKLEVDFDKKQFKNTEYYNKLNGTFKIPTWYGVELKADYEQNSGSFLNPEANLPNDGLYSVGVSVALAQGLLINERMATLKQAKLFTQQAKADQQIAVNKILFDASNAYYTWMRMYNEKEVYTNFLANALLRLEGIKSSIVAGERAAIDSVEARIAVNTRKLSLEKAKVNYIKAKLQVANFLWIQQNTPLELSVSVTPELVTPENLEVLVLQTTQSVAGFSIQEHPKIISLDIKYQSLDVNRRLKANKLLPKINLSYNFLTQEPRQINSLEFNQYKAGLGVSFPLFLRKERGDLKLAKQKLLNTQLEINTTKQVISNKVEALYKEINSLKLQTALTSNMVKDYTTLLKAEERKLELGESSLFLVNSRESKLIESRLKELEVINRYQVANAELINVLAPQL